MGCRRSVIIKKYTVVSPALGFSVCTIAAPWLMALANLTSTYFKHFEFPN